MTITEAPQRATSTVLALAETAALLVLKKKVHDYWGDEDNITKKETGK